MVIQGSVVVAVQEHAVPVTTLADWILNVDSTENVVFEIVYEHCAEAGEAPTRSSVGWSCVLPEDRRRARGRILTVHALRRRKARDNRLTGLELPV